MLPPSLLSRRNATILFITHSALLKHLSFRQPGLRTLPLIGYQRWLKRGLLLGCEALGLLGLALLVEHLFPVQAEVLELAVDLLGLPVG